MTTRLYLADSHLKECRARVLSLEDAEGGFDAVLDRTVFFPNAGGQPCDTGTLRFAGGTAAVTGADERGGLRDVAHQRAAHATPVERCVNAHSEGGNVAPARSRLDAEHQVTDDAIVKSGDQMVAVWPGL